MPIHVPGLRSRRGYANSTKRKVVAVLSLTAMVDMFTVLVVFLLQNYAVTGEVLDVDSNVKLPEARVVKELKPANVVIISKERLALNNKFISSYKNVKDTKTWLIPNLSLEIKNVLRKNKEEERDLKKRIRQAINENSSVEELQRKARALKRVTLQADQDIDFLTIKKIMYTMTVSGFSEINFAVIKKVSSKNANL